MTYFIVAFVSFIFSTSVVEILSYLKEKRNPTYTKIKVGDMFQLSPPRDLFKVNKEGHCNLFVTNISDPYKRNPEFFRAFQQTKKQKYPIITLFDIDNNVYVNCELINWRGPHWKIGSWKIGSGHNYMSIQSISDIEGNKLFGHSHNFNSNYLYYYLSQSTFEKLT